MLLQRNIVTELEIYTKWREQATKISVC